MPVRNAERFLGEAIASVQSQTCADWELLIVNDGSSDASLAIASRAAAADARIRVLATSTDQTGAGAARNLGVRAATGEFVAFLDADDLYDTGKFAFELDVLARHPSAVMTYGPTHWWFEDQPERSWTESVRGFAGALHAPPELLRRVILDQEGQVPCTCAVLIRRAAVLDAGGFFEGFPLYEDQTLWVKLMLRHPVFVHDQVLCRYRQHPHSVSAHAQAAGDYDRFRPHGARVEFLNWIENHSGALMADRRLQRALRLAFAPYPDQKRRLAASDQLVRATRQVKARVRRVWRAVQRRLT